MGVLNEGRGLRATLIVLFVLGMVIASTQTFRHIYVKWVEPRTSVLHPFRDHDETAIDETRKLEELVTLYREAKQRVRQYEADPANPEVAYAERRNREPYKTELRIEQEIRGRERDQRQLFKVKFYWGTGLVSFFVGLLVLRRVNNWLGLCGILVGASEMLCWTSPLFHNHAFSPQFTALLNTKLLLSLLTWLAFGGLWLLYEKKREVGKATKGQ